jgi:hypothetical protein
MFDSGIGGLTVLREARVLMPDRRFVYVADDAGISLWQLGGAGAASSASLRLFDELLLERFKPGAVGHSPAIPPRRWSSRRSATRFPDHPIRRHSAGHQAGGRAHLFGPGFGARPRRAR